MAWTRPADRLGHGDRHLHVHFRLLRVGAVIDGERGTREPNALLGDQPADLRQCRAEERSDLGPGHVAVDRSGRLRLGFAKVDLVSHGWLLVQHRVEEGDGIPLPVGRLPQSVAMVFQDLPGPLGVAGQHGSYLRQRHLEETQRPDPLGVAGLSRRVVTVARVLVHGGRRQQSEFVVVAQRRNGEPADLGESTDR